MPSDRRHLEVWCEDDAHRQFVRKFFQQRFGLGPRDLDVKAAPQGRGSAAQWVTANYPTVVGRARAARNQAHRGFLVMLDGDNEGFRTRKDRLCGRPDQRERSDRVAIWVPTWSVETWVLWLHGDSVTEDESYKESPRANDLGALAADAVKRWEPSRPDEATTVPSLADARVELRRLPLG